MAKKKRKTHQVVDGQLLQLNKKWGHLKQKQQFEIDAWMREEYLRSACYNHRIPNKNDHDAILTRVQEKIDERGIWLPYGEVSRHYHDGLNRYRKSLEKCEGYIHIRMAVQHDAQIVFDIIAAAFGREDEARLTERLVSGKLALPGLSLLAFQHDKAVGYVLFSRIEVVAEDGTKHAAVALAPLSVKPDFQRRGVGSALVNVGLRYAKERGHRLVILLGDPKYYGKFGFQTASKYGLISPFNVEDKYFMAKRLDRTKATRLICGKVIYPDAWN
jgi:putative acetyltransferase